MIVRSWIYVPGDRPDRFDKAASRGADAVVLDLEDAVAPASKEEARDQVRRWIGSNHGHAAQIWVRINQGEMGMGDARAVASGNISGLCVPKVDNADVLAALDELLTGAERELGVLEGTVALIPLIESAEGLENLRDIVRAKRVVQLQVGEVDLAADLGLSGDVDMHLAPVRSSILVASVAAGIDPPVGPVSTEFSDLDAFRASTTMVKGQGFLGRACIHPAQVLVVNEIFTPCAEEVAAAVDLLARMDQAQQAGSGVAIDAGGKMIDEASARSARRILALASSTSEAS